METEKYRKYIIWALIALGGAIVYRVVIDASDLRDAYSVALGEFKAKAAYAKVLTAKKAKEIKELTAGIAAKDAEIKQYQEDIGKKEAKIRKLSAHQADLEAELAGVQTDAEKVPILEGLVATWRGKYDTLSGVVESKDGEIKAWSEKYLALEKISLDYKELWQDAEGRVVALEKTRKALETDLRLCRIGTRGKTVVVVVAAGVIAYTLLKKDR